MNPLYFQEPMLMEDMAMVVMDTEQDTEQDMDMEAEEVMEVCSRSLFLVKIVVCKIIN